MPNNVLPLHLKQAFPPIIWIFTEGEGDAIESRSPFKIFSTLLGNPIYMYIFFLNKSQCLVQLTEFSPDT